MPISFGTANFVDRSAALDYYSEYGHNELAVMTKYWDGEIAFGPPAPMEGHRVFLNKDEGRYHQILLRHLSTPNKELFMSCHQCAVLTRYRSTFTGDPCCGNCLS